MQREKPLLNLKNKKTFIDLYSGIGGFHLALKSLGWDCIYFSEKNLDARKTYFHNFGELPNSLDLNNEQIENIPAHNLLCAGFPCQPYSIAGYRKGFKDEKNGDCFFKIVEILEKKQPEYFILENVKNLKTHNQGKTFFIIQRELKAQGYFVSSFILNTKIHSNIPQNRERLFIVGFLNEAEFNRFNPPSPTSDLISIENILDKELQPKKLYYSQNHYISKEINQNHRLNPYTSLCQWRRNYIRVHKEGISPTLTANMGTGGHNVPILKDAYGIRKLSPREGLRLQGFPETFQFPPDLPNSKRYFLIGNAVTIKVLCSLGDSLQKAIA